MDSKDFKAEKNNKKKKSKLKNVGQQVYVLPPNLLQKLGINLGNVGNTPISELEEKHLNLDENFQHKQYGSGSANMLHEETNNETTNLKTASLMKESLFLSPTFTTPHINNADSAVEDYVQSCNNQITYASKDCKEMVNETLNSFTDNLEQKSANNDKLEEKHNDCIYNSLSIKKKFEVKQANADKSILTCETKKKINIISEETITVAQLNEMKVLQITPENTMIPTSLHVAIGKDIKNTSVTQLQNLINFNEGNPIVGMQSVRSAEEIGESLSNLNKNQVVNDAQDITNRNSDSSVNIAQTYEALCKIQDVVVTKTVDDDKKILSISEVCYESLNNSGLDSKPDLNIKKNSGENIDNVKELMCSVESVLDTASVNYHASTSNHYTSVSGKIDVGPENIDFYAIDRFIPKEKACDQESLIREAKASLNLNSININEAREKVIKMNHLLSDKGEFQLDCTHALPNVKSKTECIALDTIETNKNNLKLDQVVEFQNFNENVALSPDDLKSTTKRSCSGNDNERNSKLSVPLIPKRNNLVSKLCIQGVEKPGGINTKDLQQAVLVKTYSNNKKIYKRAKKVIVEEPNCKVELSNTCNIDANDRINDHLVNMQQFCKCSDYGNLAYNLFDNDYEHIHFMHKKPLDCNPDIVFEIYNDDEVNKMDIRANLDDIEDTTDNSNFLYLEQHICWYNAYTPQNEVDEDFQKSLFLFNNHHSDLTKLKLENNNNSMLIHDVQSSNSQMDYEFQSHVENNTMHYLRSKSYVNTRSISTNKEDTFKDESVCYDIHAEKLGFQNPLRKRKTSYDSIEDIKRPKFYSINVSKENLIETDSNIQTSEHVVQGWVTTNKAGEINSPNVESIEEQVKCGVCGNNVIISEWSTHIASTHDYIAWKEGDIPVDLQNEDAVRHHLHNILQGSGQLVCSRCGLVRKYAKPFLNHIKSCSSSFNLNGELSPQHKKEESVSNASVSRCEFKYTKAEEQAKHVKKYTSGRIGLNTRNSIGNSEVEASKNVTCAVCKKTVESQKWLSHIEQEHHYQAWQDGTTPLDIQDEPTVKKHLYKILQQLGALVCSKCGKSRKYVKLFLQHIETCTGPRKSDTAFTADTHVTEARSMGGDDSMTLDVSSQADTTLTVASDVSQVLKSTTVNCGVCKKKMNDSNWLSHIAVNHEYLAWKDTATPIDLNSYEVICQHLANVIEDIGAIKCVDCGEKFECAKSYLTHIKSCYGKIYVETEGAAAGADDEALVTCGVCGARAAARRWRAHARRRHNYLAWRRGEHPLDLENKEAILSHLNNIISKIDWLTCAKCGLRLRSALPFYTHIQTCDSDPDATDVSSDSVIPKPSASSSADVVKCAVCGAEVAPAAWSAHSAASHDYLAWREGDQPLDTADETVVREHLYNIVQTVGELVCSKCGESSKYVKSYLQHLTGCFGAAASINTSSNKSELKKEPKKYVTCALCEQEIEDFMWMEHISKEHNYISWKTSDPPLEFEDKKSLRDYLYNIVQSIGQLVCNKCGLVRKYAKAYLQHIETCQKVTLWAIQKLIAKKTKQRDIIVTCAVCGAQVEEAEWLRHSAAEHGYLAWRHCDTPLDLNDEDAVRNHLRDIIMEEGYLECPKCKLQRKYAKLYLQHVKSCDGSKKENIGIGYSLNDTRQSVEDDSDGSVIVKCGVCGHKMERAAWIAHIQEEHQYLAWQEGSEPLDVNDQEAVQRHLYALSARCGGLACSACGLVRKYVKAYQSHVRHCNGRARRNPDDILECGVCGEKVIGMSWKDHAMREHYNIAWIVGDTPIDLRNFLSIDKYLKEYYELNRKLVCKLCGLARASRAGFYAHVLVCGKTEEEVDSWKDLCEICNQKYLCIYKTQHYWAHKVQENSRERKIQETYVKPKVIDDPNHTPGRRKAAEKAMSVIGDYASTAYSNKCKSCGFESENKERLNCERCGERAAQCVEDSDDSASIKINYSEDESEDSDVDSNISNEENEHKFVEAKKRIRNDIKAAKTSTKDSKFPLEVADMKSYLQDSKADYFNIFDAKETLFPHWRESKHEILSKELLPQYLPQLEESCKVSISNDGWTTFKRFEVRKENEWSALFAGGSVQCMSWAAARPLLALAAHRAADGPRLRCAATAAHPALLQIWDFHDFKCLPNLAFGLAHDYGTVWGMDWCPSGASDSVDANDDIIRPRLGLLAIACSNGSAYVVTVPYPDKNQTGDCPFYKIKPCVELRLSRGANKYQATSINWSMFQGYSIIFVGYGDGTLAMYDLVTESPLLTAKQGDLSILYPFQDERVHNSCVTGVTSNVQGAWCSASPTGATAGVAAAHARAGRGARPLRAHSALAASTAAFQPHWPSALLAGDDTIVGLSPSELEWGGAGRRVGSVRALAPCVRRARVALFVPPLLLTARPHPALVKGQKTIAKKNVAMIEMVPLARKRSKHTNDELSMKVEPITYEEAIATHGIEFRLAKDFDKALLQRAQAKNRAPYPERFPLADVPALAHCTAPAHCARLALATHAGLVFLLHV